MLRPRTLWGRVLYTRAPFIRFKVRKTVVGGSCPQCQRTLRPTAQKKGSPPHKQDDVFAAIAATRSGFTTRVDEDGTKKCICYKKMKRKIKNMVRIKLREWEARRVCHQRNTRNNYKFVDPFSFANRKWWRTASCHGFTQCRTALPMILDWIV